MATPIQKSVTLRMPSPKTPVDTSTPPDMHLVANAKGFAVHEVLAKSFIPKLAEAHADTRGAIPVIRLDMDADLLEQVVKMMYVEPLIVTPDVVVQWVKAFDYLGITSFATLLMDWFEAFQQEQEQLRLQANAILLDAIHMQSQRVQQMLQVASKTNHGCILLKFGEECSFSRDAHLLKDISQGCVRFVMLDDDNQPVYMNDYPVDDNYSVVEPSSEKPKKEFLEKHKII